MMSLIISEAAAVASMLGLRSRFEQEGLDQPALSIWGGPVPDDIEIAPDVDDNPLLVEFPLIGTVFGDPVREGDTVVSELLPVGGVLGMDEAVATFFRIYDRNGVPVMQGTVGIEESGADLIIDDADITTQKLITPQSLRLIQPLKEA